MACSARSYFLQQSIVQSLRVRLLLHRQIYTNFDNIWQKDGEEAKIIRDALIFYHT